MSRDAWRSWAMRWRFATLARPMTARPPLDRQVELAQYRTTNSGNDARPLSPDGFVPRKRRTDESASRTTASPIRTTTTPASRPRLDADDRLATATPRSTTSSGSSLTNDALTGPAQSDRARSIADGRQRPLAVEFCRAQAAG